MSYYDQNDTQYLDPKTGQYYTQQMYQPPQYGGWFGGMGGMNNSYSPFGYNRYNYPRIIRQNTGDVSQVWKLMQNRQPYQYNVPTLASLFPTMSVPTMTNNQPTQYTGGAGQFLGGLLGSMPAMSSGTSSGAGRFA